MRLTRPSRPPYPPLALAVTLCVLGCGGGSHVRPPAHDDFPPQELPFSMAGGVEASLRTVKGYLVDQDLPFVVIAGEPRIYVVTAYRDEPSAQGDKRLRRTAFRFGISDGATGSAAAPCSTVAITSLTISRTVQDDSWSTHGSDESYVSAAWPGMKTFLKKSACP